MLQATTLEPLFFIIRGHIDTIPNRITIWSVGFFEYRGRLENPEKIFRAKTRTNSSRIRTWNKQNISVFCMLD